jgi:hypothetical protein
MLQPHDQYIAFGVLHKITQNENDPMVKLDNIAFIPDWLGNYGF